MPQETRGRARPIRGGGYVIRSPQGRKNLKPKTAQAVLRKGKPRGKPKKILDLSGKTLPKRSKAPPKAVAAPAPVPAPAPAVKVAPVVAVPPPSEPEQETDEEPSSKEIDWPRLIKAILVAIDFTEEEYAETLGVRLSTLQKWLAGQSKPGAANREALLEDVDMHTDLKVEHFYLE